MMLSSPGLLVGMLRILSGQEMVEFIAEVLERLDL